MIGGINQSLICRKYACVPIIPALNLGAAGDIADREAHASSSVKQLRSLGINGEKMNTISFKPAADAPGAFTATPLKSRQGDRTRAMMHSRKALLTVEGNTPALVVSTKANPGVDVIAFSPSSIWAAANDLAGRAWDANTALLTDEGGGGGSGGGTA